MALDTPDWLVDTIKEYAAVLKLTHWTFEIDVVLCVNDDSSNRAVCYAQPNINHACLSFRADIENTQKWHTTIWHELIHVMHAPVDQVVDDVIIPGLSSNAVGIAITAYTNPYERFTDLLSKTLSELYPFDDDSLDGDDQEDDDDATTIIE